MITDRFVVTTIAKSLAQDLSIRNHYLHRKAPCSYAFGVFDCGEVVCRLVGIALYGVPASRNLQVGICGADEANNVIELTRLWVEDGLPKNLESFVISQSLKKVKKDIVVSFADPSVNHVGYVYQASNWVYTGLSTRHVLWKLPGEIGHDRHQYDKYGGVNRTKEALGNQMLATERPRKHRYVYFNCSKARRKVLLKKLRYQIRPYPKWNPSP